MQNWANWQKHILIYVCVLADKIIDQVNVIISIELLFNCLFHRPISIIRTTFGKAMTNSNNSEQQSRDQLSISQLWNGLFGVTTKSGRKLKRCLTGSKEKLRRLFAVLVPCLITSLLYAVPPNKSYLQMLCWRRFLYGATGHLLNGLVGFLPIVVEKYFLIDCVKLYHNYRLFPWSWYSSDR